MAKVEKTTASSDLRSAKKPEIVIKKIHDLVPYLKNARTHDDHQVNLIANSIREFGFNNPVLLDGKNGVVAGHGRLMAARILKLEEVPCIELSHLSESQKRAYILADNQIATAAGWDNKLLKEELDALMEQGFDTSLTGFTDADIAKLSDSIADTAAAWEGMPEFDQAEKRPHRQIIISFKNDIAVAAFSKLLKQKFTDKTKSVWFPEEKRMVSVDKVYKGES